MNARELEHLFGEWARVTESEGRAISGRDWEEVQQQQRLAGRRQAPIGT